MQLELATDGAKTEVGSFFVANYPPFSAWSPRWVPDAIEKLRSPAADGAAPSLGLYLHIPFCRKRCKFCYFRVFTDKSSKDVELYLGALSREVELYADSPALASRELDFVYFGGGTPSFLSSDQLKGLVERIARNLRWQNAREVTFECEPGTIKKSKLRAMKDIGVTRLSLGVEHFDDQVLELNGRAHKSPEIFRSYEWARQTGFEQINIDLIAGMMGDCQAGWEDTVGKTLDCRPDSVTIYQMEIPHNTVIAAERERSGGAVPLADWATKRAWVDYAFRAFEERGYRVSSAYTLVAPSTEAGFYYRDALWHGADMIGTGVASFSQVDGMHFQNVDTWGQYIDRLNAGELPLARAYRATPRQRMLRELILQLKLGRLEYAYFSTKFGVDVAAEFGDVIDGLVGEGLATPAAEALTLTRPGLLRVDALLPCFFEPEFRGARYT